MYEALKSPLLDNVDIEKSQKLLYIIYSCDDCPVTMSEITDVNNFMDSLSSDIEVLWGLYRDNTLGEDVKVTIIATGFDRVDVELPNKKNDDVKQERLNELMEYYYGKKKKVPSVEDSKLRSDYLCFSGFYRGPDQPVLDSLCLCSPLYFKRSAQCSHALCLSAVFCRTLFWRMGGGVWNLRLSWTFGKVRKTQCRL